MVNIISSTSTEPKLGTLHTIARSILCHTKPHVFPCALAIVYPTQLSTPWTMAKSTLPSLYYRTLPSLYYRSPGIRCQEVMHPSLPGGPGRPQEFQVPTTTLAFIPEVPPVPEGGAVYHISFGKITNTANITTSNFTIR